MKPAMNTKSPLLDALDQPRGPIDAGALVLLDKLEFQRGLSLAEYAQLIRHFSPDLAAEAAARARALRQTHYGNEVFLRGLIEFTSYCKNDCLYCGIRRSNGEAERYRLTEDQVLECCRIGYDLGFRTFVLQGGEDPAYTPERIAALVRSIRAGFPDCAITLSVGEQPQEVYALWREAGAERYLLRHETADDEHYQALHPAGMSLQNRIRCLEDLRDLGYQVGTGFMVGSPGQTPETLARDLALMQRIQPEMVGIGPFLPHHSTPFADEEGGSGPMTLFLISLLRLILPQTLLPATTSLGTLDPLGREKGILAGCNVVMPNLSPQNVRDKYMLYDNKICTGDEAAECRVCMERRIASVGYQIVVGRGDSKMEH